MVLVASSGTTHAQNKTQLVGTVEDSVSAPVAGVTVTLISLDRVLRTKSVANGSFALDDISAGTYEVEITAPGFVKQRLPLDLQDNTARLPLSIVLKVGNQPDLETCGSHSSITYGPLGSKNPRLSGIVRDFEHGKAVRNAEVTIWRTGDQGTAFRSHSDDSGKFMFEDIPTGHYDLRVAKPDYLPMEVKQLVKPRENDLFIDATVLQQNKMVACQ